MTYGSAVIENLDNYDVIVLGAGAAGLMCALTAAQLGRSKIDSPSESEAP